MFLVFCLLSSFFNIYYPFAKRQIPGLCHGSILGVQNAKEAKDSATGRWPWSFLVVSRFPLRLGFGGRHSKSIWGSWICFELCCMYEWFWIRNWTLQIHLPEEICELRPRQRSRFIFGTPAGGQSHDDSSPAVGEWSTWDFSDFPRKPIIKNFIQSQLYWSPSLKNHLQVRLFAANRFGSHFA